MTTKNSLTEADLLAIVRASGDEIIQLSAERERLGLQVLQNRPDAEAKWQAVETKIETLRRRTAQAGDAVRALQAQEDAAEIARSAAETKRLETERAEAEGKLTEALRTTEGTLQSRATDAGATEKITEQLT